MATIPSSQKFHTIATDVDTVNRGSATANADRSIFTMADIQETIDAGSGHIGGSGTIDAIPRFTASGTIGDSIITQDGVKVIIPAFVYRLGDLDTYFGFQNTDTYQVVAGGNLAMGATSGGAALYGNGVLQVNVTGSGASVTKLNLTSTSVPTGLVKAPLHIAFGVAPTAASYGIVGDIIIAGTGIYVCTVSGSDPTPATWLKATLGAL